MRDRSGHATGSPPKFTLLRFVNFGGDPKNSFFLRKLCKVILTKSRIIREYLERLIADIIINIERDEKAFENILQTFVLPLLKQENCDELADRYLHNTVNALMQTVKIKELTEVSKEYSSEEDFSKSQNTNYPKRDHNKKWNHTRSKIKTESLDELLENDDEDIIQQDFDAESLAITNVTLREIIENADEQEKQILKMLSTGYTQSEIAKKLEISQSTVSKKLAKISKPYKSDTSL